MADFVAKRETFASALAKCATDVRDPTGTIQETHVKESQRS